MSLQNKIEFFDLGNSPTIKVAGNLYGTLKFQVILFLLGSILTSLRLFSKPSIMLFSPVRKVINEINLKLSLILLEVLSDNE